MKKESNEKKQRILVADDSDDMFYLIKKGFEGEDYEFLRAKNGIEAIDILKNEVPDLILLDLKMPGKDGMEVLEILRSNRKFNGIPIIVLTVLNSSEEKIRALQIGAEDFLIKPLDPAELKVRIKTHLKLKGINEELRRYSEKLENIVEEKTRKLKEYARTLEEKVEEKVGLIKEKNRQLILSIDAASKVQLSLLPSRFPEIDGIEFQSGFYPCESISGDFYDVFRLDENNIGFFVADVSGHGVPSAMITMFLKQELTYHTKSLDRNRGYRINSPANVLKSFNRRFMDLNIGEGLYYITMIYGFFNINEKGLKLSSAGHHALPIIVKDDSEDFFLMDRTGFPIGWEREGNDYPEVEYDLSNGGIVFMYTDGLLEVYKYILKTQDNYKIFPHLADDLKKNMNFKEYIVKAIEKVSRKKTGLPDDITFLKMRTRAKK